MGGSVFNLFFTLSPVVLAGVFNMVFLKTSLLLSLRTPLDFGKNFFDGKPFFGKNKTWRGFIGMVSFSSILFGIFQIITQRYSGLSENIVIDFYTVNGFLFGAAMGFGYIIGELPNSFVKRRLGISPGTNSYDIRGLFFTFLDQADSVVGCSVMLLFFYPLSLGEFFSLIIFFSIIHYIVNIVLYLLKLKKQAG